MTSVFCKLAEAREDVLVRDRFCLGGAIVSVVVRCLYEVYNCTAQQLAKLIDFYEEASRSPKMLLQARSAVVHVGGVLVDSVQHSPAQVLPTRGDAKVGAGLLLEAES